MLTAILGDMMVIMFCRDNPEAGSMPDAPLRWYTLEFRDLHSGKLAEVTYAGENDAVLAFAAWLAADEDRLGSLGAHLDKLNASLPMGHKFLP